MRASLLVCLTVAVSGAVATTTTTAAAADPSEVVGNGAGREQNVVVEWSPYAESEPAYLGAEVGADRQISQDIPGPATMTGLTWANGTPAAVWLQTQTEGEWGAWELMDVDADHGSDEEVQRGGTQPTVVAEPEALRYLVEGSIGDAEVFVFAPPDPSLADAASRQASTPIQPEDFEPMWPGASFVRDREEWDSAGCRVPDATFDFSASTAVVVHHTAGTNNYSQSQVPGILAGLCSYQVNARDLDDMGYNFVVDRFGTVWEGRTGSKRAPIISAHTRGFNYVTQGVVLLGDFTSTQPTTAMRNGLQSILNWLTGWHGIDPDANVTLVAGSDGNGFSAGDTRTVQGVSGHRELGQTQCPGNTFFPSLRTIAANTRPTDFGNDPRQPLCQGRRLTYIGSPGNDVIDGTEYDDVILALDGDDTVYGLGGADLLCGGGGNDRLYGGPDLDRLIGEAGADNLYGGLGNDQVEGGNGNDRMYGEAGDDTMWGAPGNDTIDGGPGNDRIYAGLDNDIVNGKDGNDRIYGEAGTDRMWGSPGNDTIDGGPDDDIIYAGLDNDIVNGSYGNDRIYGDDGNDTMWGAPGNDTMDGGPGNDRMYAGLDSDIVSGSYGDDRIYGEAGNDTMWGAPGRDTMNSGPGNDRIYGGLNNDIINGTDGDDRIYGEAGNDTMWGANGNDTMNSGPGNDVIRGGPGSDIMSGDLDDDLVYGEADDDVLFGGDGTDTVDGGAGNDTCTDFSPVTTFLDCETISDILGL